LQLLLFPWLHIKNVILGATLFGWNNATAVLGKNYTIGNQPGVVGQYLIVQMNSTVTTTISMANFEVLAGI
jgi:hypothetical protein